MEFYESEMVESASIMPFIGFLVLVAGLCVIIYAAVKMVGAWKSHKMDYIRAAQDEKPDENLLKKVFIKWGIVIAVGLILVIASNFF